MPTTNPSRTPEATTGRERNPIFSTLIGICSLVILLQGLWAGLFLQPGDNELWVTVHGFGATFALVLALASTVIGVVFLRPRRDLWFGSAVLAVLLVVESTLGHLAGGGTRSATAVHVPLAMAIMALVVWLPMRTLYAPRRG